MNPKSDYARISITLPHDVLAAADRMAASASRSRSWVIAEAVRQWAETTPYTQRQPRNLTIQEPGTGAYAAAEVASGRSRQLLRNLALPPAERLRQAQDLVRLGRLAHPRRTRDRILTFNRLEEYLAWKKTDRVAG